MYVGLFPRVVTDCTRPVQDQASTNPKWRGELNVKFLLGLLAGVREREGESLFSNSVAPGKLTVLQWKATQPSIFG